jgi:hypothetical protein
MFIVKLANASSPTGVAFIGPNKADGFKTDKQDTAFQFDNKIEAEMFADHMKGRYRGFHGGADVQVVTA